MLGRLGLGEDAFLLLLAIIIGTITGVAAVSFHELINFIRDQLYASVTHQFLYGKGVFLLVIYPALGGLAVSVTSKYVFKTREGHGIVDVVESVVRSSGFQKPTTAVEKILTSAFTIGSGGSAGAEGPIVQIGAAIASGVGLMFRMARAQMPILTGCGCAAGISAIFNAPFGGVLFTLEVILQDFSIRSFTPVVLASVIAQVTVQATFQLMHHATEYRAIFAMPAVEVVRHSMLNWEQVGNFVLLGIVCGVIGSAFTRMMYWTEHSISLMKLPKVMRPALGGAALGFIGIVYIWLFGHLLLDVPNNKPFPHYPMPAFFGDGYGVIQDMLEASFYTHMGGKVMLLVLFLCAAKIVGTCLTLGSGGSGGVIAPSVFIGATTGAVVGHVLQRTGWFHGLQPELYALVAMGAVLAAVVHAPMASILIVFELTQDYKVMLPAMLACIVAVAVARLCYPESVYTLSLRTRGVRVGSAGDFVLLRRINVEQVALIPVSVVHESDPLQQLIELSAMTSTYDFVVADEKGKYEGMVYSTDLSPVLMDREAVPVLVVRDLMRRDIPPVRTTDDLAAVFDAFSRYDVNHLPVSMADSRDKVIGMISRSVVIRKYQEALKGT
ncbi:MAG TPA: chloride channel protein [Tepidisphaeraceae bacterium]|nr:chloride channel protein [Tepidisphaeraceae bacterium]